MAMPPHGVQLETHRGIRAIPFTSASGFTLATSRRFIPLPAMMDIVIHEALLRWNFRYYLAIFCRSGTGPDESVAIRVGFEVSFQIFRMTPTAPMIIFNQCIPGLQNILPHLPLLKEVYHGLREVMFEDYASSSAEDDDGYGDTSG